MVSLDDIRRKNKVKHGDQKGEGRVIQEAKKLAKTYLAARQDFVWNATNITKDRRSKVISDFEEYGAKVEVIYIEAPYKELISRNKDREYAIPNDILNKMIVNLEMPEVTECYNVQYHTQ